MKDKTIMRYAYKNTNSSAGKITEYAIKVSDIVRVHVWVNRYGNPSYGYIMANGDTYLMIDEYGAMNGLSHLTARKVSRRKDLV